MHEHAIALLVGIGKYQNADSLEEAGLRPTTSADTDALLLGRALLRLGMIENHIVRAVNEKATKQGIVDAISVTASKSENADNSRTIIHTSIVYIGGHAYKETGPIPDIHLLTHDAKIGSLAGDGNGYPIEQLINHIKNIRKEFATLLLDTCYSGAIIPTPRYVQLDVPDSVAMLTSCGRGEKAADDLKRLGHSHFMMRVVEGLFGLGRSVDHQDEVSVESLCDYVRKWVSHDSKSFGNANGEVPRQSPHIHIQRGKKAHSIGKRLRIERSKALPPVVRHRVIESLEGGIDGDPDSLDLKSRMALEFSHRHAEISLLHELSDGYGLQLMSWGEGSKVPTSGQYLVIAGLDNNGLLHIRTFDAAGVRTDTYEAMEGSTLHHVSVDASGHVLPDSSELSLSAAQAQAIAALKQQLPGLLPPHVLTQAEDMQVLGEATLITGQTLSYEEWNTDRFLREEKKLVLGRITEELVVEHPILFDYWDLMARILFANDPSDEGSEAVELCTKLLFGKADLGAACNVLNGARRAELDLKLEVPIGVKCLDTEGRPSTAVLIPAGSPYPLRKASCRPQWLVPSRDGQEIVLLPLCWVVDEPSNKLAPLDAVRFTMSDPLGLEARVKVDLDPEARDLVPEARDRYIKVILDKPPHLDQNTAFLKFYPPDPLPPPDGLSDRALRAIKDVRQYLDTHELPISRQDEILRLICLVCVSLKRLGVDHSKDVQKTIEELGEALQHESVWDAVRGHLAHQVIVKVLSLRKDQQADGGLRDRADELVQQLSEAYETERLEQRKQYADELLKLAQDLHETGGEFLDLSEMEWQLLQKGFKGLAGHDEAALIGEWPAPLPPEWPSTLGGVDLRLMSHVNVLSDLPIEGTNLIILADVQNVLHFRIFDKDGIRVVDTDEHQLSGKALSIAELKSQLSHLWGVPQVFQSKKDRIITSVTALISHISSSSVVQIVQYASEFLEKPLALAIPHEYRSKLARKVAQVAVAQQTVNFELLQGGAVVQVLEQFASDLSNFDRKDAESAPPAEPAMTEPVLNSKHPASPAEVQHGKEVPTATASTPEPDLLRHLSEDDRAQP